VVHADPEDVVADGHAHLLFIDRAEVLHADVVVVGNCSEPEEGIREIPFDVFVDALHDADGVILDA